MTLLELVNAVKLIIQDDSLDAYVVPYLNQAQLEVAGGMQSSLGSWITPPLPDLLTIGTVTTITTAAYIELPTNYQRNLQFVVSSTGSEIDIADSFISFAETYPQLDQSGSITEVADAGNVLYYQGIPKVAEDITVHYYRLPTGMSADADEPDGIPSHLQRGLLVNHTAWKLYELIEDGLEGTGLNTQRYMELFHTSLRTLELTIPYPRRELIIM